MGLLAFNSNYKKVYDLLHHLWHTNCHYHNMMHLLLIAPNRLQSPIPKGQDNWTPEAAIFASVQNIGLFSKHKELCDQLHHLWYTNHQRHNVMHLSIVFTLIQFFEPPRQQLPMANTFYKLKMFFGTFSFQFQIKRTLWPASSPLTH